jgi:tetratricopeptide (TPR) repeat protein
LDEAVQTYEEAIEARPNDPKLHQFLALLYQFGGAEDKAIARYEAAIKLYEPGLTSDPSLASAKNNLAYIYAESGVELDDALDYAQDAKAALPDSPVIADTLGWVLYKRGIPSAAISYLKEAEASAGHDLNLVGTVRHHLAQAYEADGAVDEAKDALRRALAGLDDQAQSTQAQGGKTVEPAWAPGARSMLARLEQGS